jgi:hypothetical protein
MAHTVSLIHTLTIRGDGRPELSRGTGLLVGAQYLLLGGAIHARQRMRELRAWVVASASALRRRLYLVRRSIAQQGLVSWIIVHLKELGTADAWRKHV